MGYNSPPVASVKIRENESFELALRRFKRMLEKTSRLAEMRARTSYEKPTSRRKRKLLAAVKRQNRIVRLQRQLFRHR